MGLKDPGPGALGLKDPGPRRGPRGSPTAAAADPIFS